MTHGFWRLPAGAATLFRDRWGVCCRCGVAGAAAARLPLDGVVLINPLTFFWQEGMSLKYPEHRVAADIMHRLATSPAADPSLSNTMEDQGRLAFESGKAADRIRLAPALGRMKDKKAVDALLAAFDVRGPAPSRPAAVLINEAGRGPPSIPNRANCGCHSTNRQLGCMLAGCRASPGTDSPHVPA